MRSESVPTWLDGHVLISFFFPMFLEGSLLWKERPRNHAQSANHHKSSHDFLDVLRRYSNLTFVAWKTGAWGACHDDIPRCLKSGAEHGGQPENPSDPVRQFGRPLRKKSEPEED